MELASRSPMLPSPEQMVTIDYYTNESLSSELPREMIYLSENTELSIRVATISCSAILTSTFVGTGIGMLVGKIGGPVGSLLGMKIGAGAGFAAGVTLSITHTYISIKASQGYKDWKLKAISENVYPIFREFVENSHELDDFICPLTHELILVPMKGPGDKVYEQTAIQDWIEKKEEEIKSAKEAGAKEEKIKELRLTICPHRIKPFTCNDLVYDNDYVSRLVAKVKETCEKIKDVENAKIIKEGLRAVSKNVEENNHTIFVAASTELAADLHSKNVDKETFVKIMGEHYDKFRVKVSLD